MGRNSGERSLLLVELQRRRTLETRIDPLISRGDRSGKTRKARRTRRNAKQRGALKIAGRHRGFSHGKA